ncbi:PIN domain-containing protein [candidate division KSB1 bacterium]|nr:PIN domain-containing protein [candidate division KSB1 bacterium]
MSKQIFTIDTNQMISALLGGKARGIIYAAHFRFFTTERKTWEVKRYIPLISVKTGVPQERVLQAFELFPIVAYQDAFFDEQKSRALELIGKRDPTDADLLALTLKLQCPLWSHDQDFQNIKEIAVVTIIVALFPSKHFPCLRYHIFSTNSLSMART